jgi:hypothetical protein
MAETPAAFIAPFRNTDTAPFVYFDSAPAYGVMAGAIEVELIARALIPNLTGGPVSSEVVPTARLRCSPTAAANLMESLRLALEMLKGMQEQTGGAEQAAATGGRLN